MSHSVEIWLVFRYNCLCTFIRGVSSWVLFTQLPCWQLTKAAEKRRLSMRNGKMALVLVLVVLVMGMNACTQAQAQAYQDRQIVVQETQKMLQVYDSVATLVVLVPGAFAPDVNGVNTQVVMPFFDGYAYNRLNLNALGFDCPGDIITVTVPMGSSIITTEFPAAPHTKIMDAEDVCASNDPQAYFDAMISTYAYSASLGIDIVDHTVH